MNNNTHRVGVWLALIAAFSFSMKAIFVKLAYQWPVDAITLLALRMAFSLPFFIVVGLRESHRGPPLTRRQWISVVGLGLLGFYGASLFDFIGLHYISTSLERLVLFSYPAFTLILGAVFFSQPIGRRNIGALLLCYAGIAAAFAHDLHLAQDMRSVWIGGGFIMLSSVCYAIYLVGSGRIIPVLGAARCTALAMMVSTAATLLHFALTRPLAGVFELPWQVYAIALAMALFSTVLSVFTQSAAIRRIGSSKAALIGTIGPVMTISMSAWILGEAVTYWQWIGTALVLAGVLLTGRK